MSNFVQLMAVGRVCFRTFGACLCRLASQLQGVAAGCGQPLRTPLFEAEVLLQDVAEQFRKILAWIFVFELLDLLEDGGYELDVKFGLLCNSFDVFQVFSEQRLQGSVDE